MSKAGQLRGIPNKIRVMKRQAFLAAACLATLSLLSACKPKAGGACKLEAKEICAGDKQALACHEGKWEEIACKGPGGCNSNRGAAERVCDQSVVDETDACSLAKDVVCSQDKKGMLECKDRHWTFLQSCLGARGCTTEPKRVVCDNSIAKVDDACREAEDSACSGDGKSALACRGGKFVVVSLCKGPKGCAINPDPKKPGSSKVDCDDTVAGLGEPCEKESHYACAGDERSVVKCVGKKWVQDEKCRTKEKCSIRGEQAGCY